MKIFVTFVAVGVYGIIRIFNFVCHSAPTFFISPERV